MTEPSNTTRAKAHAKKAAEEASEAATEASRGIRSSIRDGYVAVRDNAEVQSLRQGVRQFARQAENPALIVATAVNPALGLGLTGIVKGSRLAVQGLRAEAERADTDAAE